MLGGPPTTHHPVVLGLHGIMALLNWHFGELIVSLYGGELTSSLPCYTDFNQNVRYIIIMYEISDSE